MSRKILTSTLIIFGCFLFGRVAFAEITADHLVFSQIQITGGPGKTTNDFVEMFNPTSQDLDLKGYRLVKRTKTAEKDTLIKSWTESAIVKAQGYYLWANKDYVDISATPDVTTSGSFANDNGVALRQGSNDTGIIIDAVAWGQAVNAFVEGQVFSQNPGAGESLLRIAETNNNAQDFVIAGSDPRSSSAYSVTPPPPPPPAPAPTTSAPTPQTVPLPPPLTPPPPAAGEGKNEGTLRITELLPDPLGSDEQGEFIEFQNFGESEIDLAGFSVSDSRKTYKIKKENFSETRLKAGAYFALYLKGTGLSLNNEGETIKLLDFSGETVDIVTYGAAPEGESYAWVGMSNLQWTIAPTPGESNVIKKHPVIQQKATSLSPPPAPPSPPAAREETRKSAIAGETTSTPTATLNLLKLPNLEEAASSAKPRSGNFFWFILAGFGGLLYIMYRVWKLINRPPGDGPKGQKE